MHTSTVFNRALFIQKLAATPQWDVIVIGGGATGLGIALDSASRGYTTLLLEQADFAKGTSSRSTKLVHGGVRYLAQGNIQLVYSALKERGLLLQNAPHLVKKQSFIIPCYSWFSCIKFFAGLKLYDWLSGSLSFGASSFVNRKEVAIHFPNINKNRLTGGVEYYDGQFDDARLAINMAQTAAAKGGMLLNYCKVLALVKEEEKVRGVKAVDLESGVEYKLKANVVINATGVFVDDVLNMDRLAAKPLVRPSQGVHLVVNKAFLGEAHALMIPDTADGRVLFAIPWQQHLLLGTTDTPLHAPSVEPVALEEEMTFILNTVKQYLHPAPAEKDVLSVFAGLRPLTASSSSSNTKDISRDHKLMVSASGLITITGGKWTTYRKMAEETVNKAIEVGGLPFAPCATQTIPIHGASHLPAVNAASLYGTDAAHILQLVHEKPSLSKKLLEGFPYTEAEVVWAARNEMARTVEDVLARRLRILFLDAKAAIRAAPKVAALMAPELGYDKQWEEGQVLAFTELAYQYLPQQPVTTLKKEDEAIIN